MIINGDELIAFGESDVHTVSKVVGKHLWNKRSGFTGFTIGIFTKLGDEGLNSPQRLRLGYKFDALKIHNALYVLQNAD